MSDFNSDFSAIVAHAQYCKLKGVGFNQIGPFMHDPFAGGRSKIFPTTIFKGCAC